MSTLKTTSLLKSAQIAVVASLIISPLACDEEDRFVLRFSHFLHAEEEDMGCADCHGELSDSGFALPGHDICVDCHDDIVDAEEIARDTCGVCHVEKDLEAIGEAPAPETVTRGVFRHAEALADACTECHGEMLKEGVDHVELPSRSDVLAMRERAHGSGRSCESCHAELRRDVAPANHHENWKRRHGLFAPENQALCGMCHMEEGCRECHQEEAPLSHTNLWRLRVHGIEGYWGRESCQTCHQEDFCVECHRDTRPRSHGAAWERQHGIEAPLVRDSCQTCHQADFCTECHLETPPSSHTPWAQWARRHGIEASFRPESCQMCHQADFCTGCHLETPPSSHTPWAAWERRHCFECHLSTGTGSGCEVCHVTEIELHEDLMPTDHPFDLTEVEAGAWCSSAECHPGLWTRHAFSDEGECLICHR
jgi:hypothetical protein